MWRAFGIITLAMLAVTGCGRWKQDVACERACALAVNDGGAPDSSFDDRRDTAEVDQALAKADEACSSRPDLKSLAQQARATVEKARKKKAEEKAALEQAKAEKAGDAGPPTAATASASASASTTASATPPAGAAAISSSDAGK